MNEYHRDAGHQGQWQTLSLLQEQVWWHGMAMQIQRVISSCERCIQHEGAHAKALLQTILGTSPLELLHVDFTGIEMVMDLDWPPHAVNVLVFCDHFMRHIMVYVTPDQTAKTLVKFLWQGYISIFSQAPEWLRGQLWEQHTSSASCVSSWAFRKQELCHTTPRLMDRWIKLTKCWYRWLENWVKIRRQTGLSTYWKWYILTIPWDQPSPDTAHTIWGLGNDHAYPLTFIFPLSWLQKNTSMSITILVTYVSNCMKPSRKCKCSPHLRLKGRGNTMIAQLMLFHWNQATWCWLKPMPTKGGERWKTSGRRNCTKWNT